MAVNRVCKDWPRLTAENAQLREELERTRANLLRLVDVERSITEATQDKRDLHTRY